MYRNLRTNLPKEIMAYRELPWNSTTTNTNSSNDSGNEPASFVTHAQVAAYLQRYCCHFELDRLVRKGCHVVQLTCLPHTASRITPLRVAESLSPPPLPPWPQIRLDWTCGDQVESQVYDAVVICNGHYNVPAYPTVPGLTEYFKGNALHSVAYDTPQPFTDQTVLCIGARASGSDLAREISAVARTVYVSDSAFWAANQRNNEEDNSIRQDNVVWVPRTTRVLPNGRVALASTVGNRTLEQSVEVDTIIFCTGYDYSFPFINDQSNLNFETSQRRVQPLFEQLWHAECPNIAFVGLPHSVVPFPLFELQAQAVERSWRCRDKDDDHTNGDSPCLHDATLLRASAARDAESGGPLAGRVPQDTHYLGSAQWEYCRRMARYAGNLDQETEDYIATNKVRISLNVWVTDGECGMLRGNSLVCFCSLGYI
jgi:Flavin-binding monooxygenase-like